MNPVLTLPSARWSCGSLSAREAFFLKFSEVGCILFSFTQSQHSLGERKPWMNKPGLINDTIRVEAHRAFRKIGKRVARNLEWNLAILWDETFRLPGCFELDPREFVRRKHGVDFDGYLFCSAITTGKRLAL
jgi:hypothetical protein